MYILCCLRVCLDMYNYVYIRKYELFVSECCFILLSITVPAKLTDSMIQSTVSGDKGTEMVSLTCVASGAPPPTITWHRSNSQDAIKADVKETDDASGNYKSTLTLRNGEDAGDYYCTVKNEHSKLIQHSFASQTTSECSLNRLLSCLISFPLHVLAG